MGDLTWLEVHLGAFLPDQQNFRMAFDLAYPNNRYIHASLVKNEVFDWPFATVLTQFLVAGDTFIDIGSHIGYYSLLARRFVGDTGNVYAFEPSPETYGILLSSIQLNAYRNVTAFNCAISDQEHVLEFTISDIDDGLSSLMDVGGRRISVYSTTLDALHERLKFSRVRVMKIDVEGFETAVIKGGRNFFRDVMPESVAFEVNNQIPGVARHQDQPLRAYFASMGYKSYLVKPLNCGSATSELFGDSLFLEIPVDILLGGLEYGNIFATRRRIDAPVLA